MMKCNVGAADRWIRIVIGIALFGLFFLPGSSMYWGLIGFVPLLTGIFKWCPLYAVLGLSTCSRKAVR